MDRISIVNYENPEKLKDVFTLRGIIASQLFNDEWMRIVTGAVIHPFRKHVYSDEQIIELILKYAKSCGLQVEIKEVTF